MSLRVDAAVRALVAAAGLAFLLLGAPARAALPDELREATRLHHIGESQAALARIDAWLQARPREAQMRFLKSVVLADLGRRDEAIALLEQMTQDYPEIAEPHNNLAVLHAAAGDWASARRELELALRLNPAHAAAHENLGDVYLVLARQSYERALAAEPGNPRVPRKLALVRDLAGAAALR